MTIRCLFSVFVIDLILNEVIYRTGGKCDESEQVFEARKLWLDNMDDSQRIKYGHYYNTTRQTTWALFKYRKRMVYSNY